MQDYIGKQIDRYRIIERLGMGGMAVVYKAYDTRLERNVALKLIRTDAIPAEQHGRLMKRFEREAKAQARFSHQNIVPVYDYGQVDGSPYLVMVYIPGGTLKARTGKPIPYQQAIRWLLPVADALDYAHMHNVIHRDIKPSNILFNDDGRPLLTDFGIAKVLETAEATLTGTGLGVGTPEYMAPEQWQGKAFPATDQYALGVVLYELMTGKKPYTADTPAAIAILQATEPLRRPSELVKGIPEQVEKVLYKALAKDPQDRYVSMGAFKKSLGGLIAKADEKPPNRAVVKRPTAQKEQKQPKARKTRENKPARGLNLLSVLKSKYFWISLLILVIFLGIWFGMNILADNRERIAIQSATKTAQFSLLSTEQSQNTTAGPMIDRPSLTPTATFEEIYTATSGQTESQELSSTLTRTPSFTLTITKTSTRTYTSTPTTIPTNIQLPPTNTPPPPPTSTRTHTPPPPPTSTRTHTPPPPPTNTKPPPPTNTPVPTNTPEARPPTPTPP